MTILVEPMDPAERLLVGTGLAIAGIAVVSLRYDRRVTRSVSGAAA